jgi:hypothetical protein
MATLGWIHFSPTHRERVGSVLDLLRPEGMVDELGLGNMRDALANELFPGISTIQTRAKYFFIVPYILYDYQMLPPAKRSHKNPSRYLEDTEFEVMWDLAERYDHKEGSGVIGISMRRPKKLARRPSTIYWNGLYTYMFVNTGGLSSAVFLSQAVRPAMETLLAASPQGDDGPADDADAEYESAFKIRVPYKQNWKENLMLDLDKDEAEFFRDRILSTARNRLIAEVLINKDLRDEFFQAESFMDFAKSADSIEINPRVKSMITLAHDFSQLMYGVHLAYNCQLQKVVFRNDYYDEQFRRWSRNIKSTMLDYQNFNPENVFSFSPTTLETTKQFIRDWWDQTKAGFPNLNRRDFMIKHQESTVKRAKARLEYNKTDDVKEHKWIGLEYFNYRHLQAKLILHDIVQGLDR